MITAIAAPTTAAATPAIKTASAASATAAGGAVVGGAVCVGVLVVVLETLVIVNSVSARMPAVKTKTGYVPGGKSGTLKVVLKVPSDVSVVTATVAGRFA